MKNIAAFILITFGMGLFAQTGIYINGVEYFFSLCPGGLFSSEGVVVPLSDERDQNLTETKTVRIRHDFEMLQTETTRKMWADVYDWATTRSDNKYSMNNAASNTILGEKGDLYPVLATWRDAVVWCNALTEYYNEANPNSEKLDCVYYSDPEYRNPIRNSMPKDYLDKVMVEKGSVDNPYIKSGAIGNTDIFLNTARGFRLPTIYEWDFAARYRGDDRNNSVDSTIDGYDFSNPPQGLFWTKGDSASGAKKPGKDYYATREVAWTNESRLDIVKGTIERKPNALGIFDMSGNVWELTFDWFPGKEWRSKIIRGGDLGGFKTVYIGRLNGDFGLTYKGATGLRVVRTKYPAAVAAQIKQTNILMLLLDIIKPLNRASGFLRKRVFFDYLSMHFL